MMLQRLSALLACVAGVVMTAASGCGDGGGSTRCVPGQTVACGGPSDCAGSQTCKADGTYGACTCLGGGGSGGTTGAGGSGNVDAGAGGSIFIDAGPIDAPTVSCDPVSQSPCPPDQRCAWVWTAANDGHSACLSNAAVGPGGACMIRNGVDNCRRGTACVSGTCQTLCGLSPNTCGSGFRCGQYVEVPFNPSGTGTTGYCDPLCDPLSQRRGFDNAPACGSPIPADPTLGCYGTPGRPFTCAPAGDPDRTSDAPASLAPDGFAYLNGCAPGYMPLRLTSSLSTVEICAALCEPGPTSAQNPANAAGKVGSLHTCPAKGANRHECKYWWFIEDWESPAFPSTFSNTLGFCIDPTQHLYDRDGNGTLDTTIPSCASLSNTARTFTSSYTDDLFWGCAPLPP